MYIYIYIYILIFIYIYIYILLNMQKYRHYKMPTTLFTPKKNLLGLTTMLLKPPTMVYRAEDPIASAW